jgi:thiamine kinase-like enzyme
MSLNNNDELFLIDFEYGGWNPVAYDIANYLNEWCTDNAYPYESGVKIYLSNFPTNEEIEYISKCYQECSGSVPEDFVDQIKRCMLLNNFYWAVWAFMMLKPENYLNDKTFNYCYAAIRAQMYKHACKQFGM